MKKWVMFGALLALLIPVGAAGFGWTQYFQVKPREFDPGKTFLVQAEWLAGIGCPTNARQALFPSGYGPNYTDPACPTGDSRDQKNEGLLLAKTGPTTNFASAVADIEGVEGKVLTELGWDIRKPGLSLDPRGSHCGGGAPRFNVETDNGFYFIGCNSPVPQPAVETPGQGYLRMRWGAIPTPPFGERIRQIQIVFDEGYDTGPDNFGLAVLDNIDVNGVLVGQGPGDGDDDDDDEREDDGDGPRPCDDCDDDDD
jgi:hypothetical protein